MLEFEADHQSCRERSLLAIMSLDEKLSDAKEVFSCCNTESSKENELSDPSFSDGLTRNLVLTMTSYTNNNKLSLMARSYSSDLF